MGGFRYFHLSTTTRFASANQTEGFKLLGTLLLRKSFNRFHFMRGTQERPGKSEYIIGIRLSPCCYHLRMAHHLATARVP